MQRHKGDGVWLIRHDEHDLFAYKDFYPLLNVNNTLIALMNSQMTDDMVIEILRMMIKYNTVIPIRSLNYAINNYRENVVKWYIKNFPDGITSSFINIAFFIMATTNGSINIVELLHQHLSMSGKLEYVTHGYSNAINNRNLRLLEWLHNHGYTPSTNPIAEAVVKGYLDIIIWLYERGYNYTADGGFLAVMRNNYNDVLEWLINHNDNDRINLNTSMSFDAAAYAGDLELLRYLYDTSPDPRGVSGDGFMDAISRGHLNVLRYLFEEREIDMDSEYLHSLEQIASNRKQQDILDYLRRISIYTNGRLPIRNFSSLT